MKNTTKYYRVVKNENYSVISNGFIRRKDLSWKAKGILTYILTLPDDWKINLNEITTHATDGEKSFRSGWKELETAGYIKRYPVRNGQRISHWETIIRESVDIEPSAELSCSVDVQDVDVQKVDVQNVELLSTYNNQVLKEQNTNKPSSAKLTEWFEKVWSYYPRKEGKSTSKSIFMKEVKAAEDPEEMYRTIGKGVYNYAEMMKAEERDRTKIKMGSVFFNNKSWEDEDIMNYHKPKKKVENKLSMEEALRQEGGL